MGREQEGQGLLGWSSVSRRPLTLGFFDWKKMKKKKKRRKYRTKPYAASLTFRWCLNLTENRSSFYGRCAWVGREQCLQELGLATEAGIDARPTLGRRWGDGGDGECNIECLWVKRLQGQCEWTSASTQSPSAANSSYEQAFSKLRDLCVCVSIIHFRQEGRKPVSCCCMADCGREFSCGP